MRYRSSRGQHFPFDCCRHSFHRNSIPFFLPTLDQMETRIQLCPISQGSPMKPKTDRMSRRPLSSDSDMRRALIRELGTKHLPFRWVRRRRDVQDARDEQDSTGIVRNNEVAG